MYILCNSADILWVRMEMESISGSDHRVSGLCSSWLSTGLRSGWQLISEFWVSGCSEMLYTLTKITTRVKYFISHQRKKHSYTWILYVVIYWANVIPMIFFYTLYLRECWVSMHVLFQHFIFIHPHKPAPQICPQQTTVKYYWPLNILC